MRSSQEANLAVDKYADMIRRICFLHLKNKDDTEDIFQTVFLKYILYLGTFENAEHEKAWFIRVTINACKDFLKSFFRNQALPIDVLAEEAAAVTDESGELLG
ncbi:MAG: sigma factor, partial [Oscillospiraceae bacterium]